MQHLAQYPLLIIGIILSYFAMLYVVSWYNSRGEVEANDTFFKANRNAPWALVAIGMIGASLSGVTFISIPGLVGKSGANENFAYMQMVFGYLLGYFAIATVLMPIYYKYNLTSIYGYLDKRLGTMAYKTGAGYFLLSRLLGSSVRLYLVAIVLDKFVFMPLGIPFFVTVLLTILLIWVYTSKSGIKTIIITDVIQTVAMIVALVLTIYHISSELGIGVSNIIPTIMEGPYSKMWYFGGGWSDPNNFFKQFLSGALIALVMTGLDQDMMQKNLTCKTLGDAQKNMFTFSISLILANLLFLCLGAFLYMYIASKGDISIPATSDYLYPTLAFEHFPLGLGIVFIIGLIAAAYSSADSAMTALTTSFCVDFLGMEKNDTNSITNLKNRKLVHIGISVMTFLTIIAFKALNNDAVVNGIFKIAGYTYGPLLGLFAFSVLTKRNVRNNWVLPICILAPILTYFIDSNSVSWFSGLTLGYMNLALNGLLTFIGLVLISRKVNN